MTIPVANAIRDHFPNAFLCWAIESPGDFLIKECDSVDEVINVPKGWLKKPAVAWKLRKQLRALKLDYVVDPQSLTKSSALGWISGARHRIGLTKPHGRELSTWFNNVRVSVESPHVADRSLEMLSVLGIKRPSPRFDLKIPQNAMQSSATCLEQLGLDDSFVVLNPGAGWQSRQWCNQRFGEVAIYLKQRGLKCLVTWFGDVEEKMANEIVAASGGVAIKAPSTRLWELAGLISRSQFYLGCDTGPTHLAAALNTPCITLFGTTEPVVSGPYFCGEDSPHVCVQKFYQAGSSRERRKAANVAMLEIGVDDIKLAVDQMIQKCASSKAA